MIKAELQDTETVTGKCIFKKKKKKSGDKRQIVLLVASE